MIEERMRSEVQKVFAERRGGEPPIYFPEKSSQIPDRPSLTFVVLAPDQSLQNEKKSAGGKVYGKGAAGEETGDPPSSHSVHGWV